MATKDNPVVKVDRLSLLPAELRSRIYFFVFHSSGNSPTLHVRSRLNPRAWATSLLRLLWSAGYKESKFYHSSPEWPEHIEAAFVRGETPKEWL